MRLSKFTLLTILLTMPSFCYGELRPPKNLDRKATVSSTREDALADKPATFRGEGIREFEYWLGERIAYPLEGQATEAMSAVTVGFAIESDGTLSEATIISSSDDMLSDAVMTIVQSSPAWEPAIENGIPVKSTVEVTLSVPSEASATRESYAEDGTPINTYPRFLDGDLNTFRNWVNSNLRYPESARKNNIQGVVYVDFDVLSDGNVRNIKIVKSPDPYLSKETRRVISMSPAWIPAYQEGSPKSFKFHLPVIFKLEP